MDGLNAKISLYKSRFMNDYRAWDDPRNVRGQDNNGAATRRNMKWDRDLMEITLNYDKTFGSENQHKVEGLAGYSWESNTYGSQYAYATNFAVTSMGADNIQTGNTLKIGNVTSDRNNCSPRRFF